MIYNFKQKQVPQITQVGGKAKALIETTGAGFPVPEGIVLSVDFFKPWLETIKNSEFFEQVNQSVEKETCDKLKEMAEGLQFTKEQKSAFDDAIKDLDGKLFAVRSSSPEEDLEGTSFAGMYETVLGVTVFTLEKNIAKAFASCLDYRVMTYKKQNGLDIYDTKIAVVVQRQINSDVSGVGFSLNPINNCYDEVFINASFGLGEAIVSGIVTPDHYTYDCVKKEIIDKKIGEKAIGLFLKEDGGIEEKPLDKLSKNQALTDEQITELSQLIKKCEAYYGMPMDTEWAYEDGSLYLLQSRPITTYLPFFEELMTQPGEKKKFYLDLMVMTQGFDEPMSVLGLELWSKMLEEIKAGILESNIKGTAPVTSGRQYLSVTGLQKLIGKKNTQKILDDYDLNVRKIFKSIDLAPHFPEQKPEGNKGYKKKMFKTAVTMLPGVIKGAFFNYRDVISAYERDAKNVIDKANSLSVKDDFKYNAEQVSELMVSVMGSATVVMAGFVAQRAVKKIFKGEDIENEIVTLAMDLKGNPTSEMGHLLYKMACQEEFIETNTKKKFVKKCQERSYSVKFMKDFDEFMEKFAVRGMKEIDVASMRADEDFGILYDKLKEINIDQNQIKIVKEKRKIAYEKLRQRAKQKGKEQKFIKAAEKYQLTFGYREHPKYLIVYILGKLHHICLELAEEWVKEGRLQNKYQVFDLHADEIAQAQQDKNFDLMSARTKNLEGYKKVEHVKQWPIVIDSRGKIYKPELEVKDGDIMGEPIASGKVTGRAKVLHSPYEKSLEPGEILIARATEPSWTPIFTNAAGVIMEIGGPLQHGGIIAREYGIPCVSGLIGIMEMIEDGDLIEVDGTNGVVKILEKSKE